MPVKILLVVGGLLIVGLLVYLIFFGGGESQEGERGVPNGTTTSQKM